LKEKVVKRTQELKGRMRVDEKKGDHGFAGVKPKSKDE
jgi:hypothetical protein